MYPPLSCLFYSITSQLAEDLGNVTNCKASGSLLESISHLIISEGANWQPQIKFLLQTNFLWAISVFKKSISKL